jgi:hypothetical protein
MNGVLIDSRLALPSAPLDLGGRVKTLVHYIRRRADSVGSDAMARFEVGL